MTRPGASRLERLHSWAAVVWLALIGGGGLGFVARDVLQAGRPLVAVAWLAGAALAAAPALARVRGRARDAELGQASVEWVGLVLVCTLALGALATLGPSVDGRSFGGLLAHRIACAVRGGCDDGARALADAYGGRDAALVRAHAPSLVYERGERQLPVDWRRCRSRACADAPDEAGLDVHRSDAGERATVFTRLRRVGGRTYIQYWLYYPDSNTTFAGADRAWEASWLLPRLRELVSGTPDWPGFHRDDWEIRPGAARPGRQRLGARELARPLPGLQGGGVPQPMDLARGLGPRLLREPRGPHPARRPGLAGAHDYGRGAAADPARDAGQAGVSAA